MGTALVTSASAADLGGNRSFKDDSPSSFDGGGSASWTGPWIGASVGYGVGTLRPDGYDFGYSAEGIIAKIDAGIDVQFGHFVAGLSLCAEYVDVDDAQEALCAGGRLGLLITPDSLIYVPAGYRWQGIDTGGDTEYLSGPYVGLGLESRFTPSTSFKLEYQHTFYWDEGGHEIPDGLAIEDNRIMGGINIRFGGDPRKLF
jgi:hypothetical protein